MTEPATTSPAFELRYRGERFTLDTTPYRSGETAIPEPIGGAHELGVGTRAALFIDRAVHDGVLVVPSGVYLETLADNDAEGGGVYLLLGNVPTEPHRARPAVFLTSGWTNATELVPSEDECESLADHLQVHYTLDSLLTALNTLLRQLGPDADAPTLAAPTGGGEDVTRATGYPRTVAYAISRMFEAVEHHQLPVLDEILRAAGLCWEHIGCWTNTTRTRTCGNCGRRRSTLERRGEVLP